LTAGGAKTGRRGAAKATASIQGAGGALRWTSRKGCLSPSKRPQVISPQKSALLTSGDSSYLKKDSET